MKKISRTGTIYIIRNKCNDKVYIGQTTQSVDERFKQHLKPSEHKRHGGYKIYRAMNKYGSENFYYEILEDNIPYELLDEREVYYIEKFDSFNNGYNSTPGGDKKTIYKIEDVDNVISRLKQGEMIKDIASDYNVNPITIRRTLQAYGIHTPRDIQGSHKREDLRTLPREEIRKLYEDGLSHKEIASKLGINPRSVSRVIREFGIRKRKMIDYNSLDLVLY